MISHNILANRSLHTWLWNLMAIVCALFAGSVVGAIVDDATGSPTSRLAFACLSYVAIMAASRGRLLHRIFCAAKYIKTRFHRVIPGFICLAIIMSIAFGIFVPVFKQAQTYAREEDSSSIMRINGIALRQFAEDRNQTLPKNITPQNIGNYLKGYQPELSLIDPISEKPFIWRHSLSGVNIKEVKHPEKVIVAYSLPYRDETRRMVLFLDGRTEIKNERQFWELLRQQRTLLPEKVKL